MKMLNAYGCVKCQDYHYQDEPIYQQHIGYQSKHGIVKRKDYRHGANCDCDICTGSREWYRRNRYIKKILDSYTFVVAVDDWNIYRRDNHYLAHHTGLAVLYNENATRLVF